MKKQIPIIIGWLLLIIAFSVYLYGIYFAIFTPLTKENKVLYIPEPLDSILSTIGAILLANLGAVLGISVTNPSSGLARMILIGKKMPDIPDPVTQREIIQYFAVILYLFVLIVCFIFWAKNTFVADEKATSVVSLVSQNGKTLFGVIAAYVAFVLGAGKS